MIETRALEWELSKFKSYLLGEIQLVAIELSFAMVELYIVAIDRVDFVLSHDLVAGEPEHPTDAQLDLERDAI